MTTKSGDKYSGILSNSVLESTEASVTLSMTRKTYSASQGQTNGVTEKDSPFMGSGPDFKMTFKVSDLADMAVPDLVAVQSSATQNGTPHFSFSNITLTHVNARNFSAGAAAGRPTFTSPHLG